MGIGALRRVEAMISRANIGPRGPSKTIAPEHGGPNVGIAEPANPMQPDAEPRIARVLEHRLTRTGKSIDVQSSLLAHYPNRFVDVARSKLLYCPCPIGRYGRDRCRKGLGNSSSVHCSCRENRHGGLELGQPPFREDTRRIERPLEGPHRRCSLSTSLRSSPKVAIARKPDSARTA